MAPRAFDVYDFAFNSTTFKKLKARYEKEKKTIPPSPPINLNC